MMGAHPMVAKKTLYWGTKSPNAVQALDSSRTTPDYVQIPSVSWTPAATVNVDLQYGLEYATDEHLPVDAHLLIHMPQGRLLRSFTLSMYVG